MRNFWIVAVALAGALIMGSGFARRGGGQSASPSHRLYPFRFHHPGRSRSSGEGRCTRPGAGKRPRPSARAEGGKVYAALVGLTGERPYQVRRATPEEIEGYGKRRGFEPAKRPLFTLRAGDLSLIVHYDLQAANILFVGQLGVLDPDPRPVPAPKLEQVAAAQPALKKDARSTWSGPGCSNTTARSSRPRRASGSTKRSSPS